MIFPGLQFFKWTPVLDYFAHELSHFLLTDLPFPKQI